MVVKKSLSHFLFFLIFFPGLYAQQTMTMAEAILKGRSTWAPASPRQLQWVPGTDVFSQLADGKVVRTRAASGASDTLDLLPQLNPALTAAGIPALSRLPAFTWMDANNLWFTDAESHIVQYTLGGAARVANRYPAGADHTDIHDTTFNAAYLLGDSLFVNTRNRQLFVAASEAPGIVYGKSVHREEFGISKGTFWSTSGRYLAFYRMDERAVTEYPVYVLDSMPAQGRMVRYPFAGSRSHHVTVGVFDTRNPGKIIYLNTGEPAEQYLTNIAWSPDDRYILIAVVNRAQNHLWLRQYDATSGALVQTLFEETNDRWVEPENPPAFIPGSNTDFIWQSERDGYNHLYRYSLKGGNGRQLTSGPAPVTRFYGFSANGSRAFYQMADTTGLNRQVFSLETGSGKSQRLSEEPGMHSLLYSTTGEWVLDIYTNQQVPRNIAAVPVKKSADRQVIFSAENPVKNLALGETRLHTILSPGGVPLNARLILPVNFNPSRQYPCIVYVYGGPHAQLVTNSWLAGAELWMHRMAQLGYVVFTVDNRGSAHRGFAFESAIFRNIGEAEIADQLAGVAFLKQQPFIDTTRLGVFGWSYGGFMTTSLMTRPEAAGTFRTGVAGGPVIDWRMYEIMYTERYMDSPQENAEGYNRNSLFQYIGNLKGDLLIIHGTSDDVVLWQHSLRYIREAVRQGVQLDYFVYPEHLHNVLGRDRAHLFEKVERYFEQHLK